MRSSDTTTSMDARMARRRFSCGVLACIAAPAHALMAGEPPDAPLRRIDVPSPRSPWSGVAAVTLEGRVGTWTAVRVGRRHVLTAAHVVLGQEVERLRIHFGIEAPRSHVVGAARVVAHPFHRSTRPSGSEADLALVELAQDGPQRAQVHPIDVREREPGELLTLVGYGGSGFGAIGVSAAADAGTRRVGTNRIERVMPGGVQTRPWIYLFKFDAPGQGDAVPGETGLASGDSGSPAYTREGSEWRLYGINTFITQRPGAKPSTFGTTCGGQVLAPHVEWIRQVTDAA